MKFQKLGILIKDDQLRSSELIASIRSLCEQMNLDHRELILHASEDEMLELCQWSDLVVVVGGDGSILQASLACTHTQVPVCGINSGRVGFLADIESSVAVESLRKIIMGEYSEESSILIQSTTPPDGKEKPEQKFLALNEFVVHSQGISQLLEIELRIDDKLAYQCRADGLIIATPIGSTAYSLSAGGPIMQQSLDCLTIVPMLPYAMHAGSIVVSSTSKVSVKILQGSRYKAVLTKDGQKVQRLAVGHSIVFTQATKKLNLIKPQQADYFDAMRRKLQWGKVMNTDPM